MIIPGLLLLIISFLSIILPTFSISIGQSNFELFGLCAIAGAILIKEK